MNYELAKKLKDAGFPQHEGEYRSILEGDGKERVYTPDLGELVRECGDRFHGLWTTGTRDRWGSWSADTWLVGVAQDTVERVEHCGSTPEEAVAELWLALHTK